MLLSKNKRNWGHGRYCLVDLSVKKSEAAVVVHRLLSHLKFDTEAKRMGKVIRVNDSGLSYWQLRVEQEQGIDWAK